MATLACHASHVSSSSIPACATDEWQGDLDEDGFIQEDNSVPACIEQSEADTEDVLEALIQAELAKFQQQQADRYAELLSDGHALMPLSSPAPVQQQLRAQQRQQEVLIDVASLHEQERYEYVPSARATLDAEQLMLQPSAGLQGAASSYTQEQRQQLVEAEHSQLCSEPASTSSLNEDSPWCSKTAETVCAEGAPTLASAEPHAQEPPAAAVSAAACTYESQGDVDCIDPAACSPSDLQPCSSSGTADGAAEGMQQLADTCSQGPWPRSSTDHACADAAWSELPAEAEPQPTAAHTSLPCADPLVGPASAAAAVPDPSANADVASTAAPGAAADTGWEDQAEGLMPLQPQEQEDPAQMQYIAQQLSKLQLQQASQASMLASDCSGAEEPAADAAEVCNAQDSIMPTEPLLEPCESAVECPELPLEQSEQLVPQEQEGCEQQHGLEYQEDQPHELQERLQQQHEPGQQQQQQPQGDAQAGGTEDAAVTHVDAEPQTPVPVQSLEAADGQTGPDGAAPLAAIPDAAAASAAPADVAADDSVLVSGADGADSEGFIYQDDDQSASPASPASPAAAVTAAAHAPAPDSWQAAAARTSTDAAAAAAAAFAAMSLGAVGIGELSPWETAGTAEVAPDSAQHVPALGSSRQSTDSSRLSPRQRQQQSPRPPQSPRQQSPRHQRVQQQHHGPTSAELAQQQHAQQQLPQSYCRASHRPSSAPAGGSRHKITMVGPAAAQLALRPGAQASAGLSVVAESSREGPCGGRLGPRQVESQLRQPISTQMQFYTGAAAVAEWTSSMHHQQHQEEEHYQQQILARMQQLQQPARPVSADAWRRSSSQPRGQHMPAYEQQQQRKGPQQRQQQQHRRAGPAWDDSPMPLHVPKWVPIAQAVQLPSTTVAANVAYCSWGSGLGNSILGGTRGAWLADAARADAGGRPQTAGSVMSHSHMQPWESVQQQPLDRSGCLTARSASTSPSRWRSAAQPTSSAAAAAATAAAIGGIECAHSPQKLSSCSAVPAGQPCRSPSPTDRAGSSSSGGRAQASTYLLDVLQQVRQANSNCRQLGLNTQYKLAEGDSKKDKWQLEQIEIELWTLSSSSSVQEHPQQQYQQQLHAVGDCQWQLRKTLSMPQFTAHLNRLKGSNPVAAAQTGLGSAVPAVASSARPSNSAYAAVPAGAGSTASWVASFAAPSVQRALSPDRIRARNPQACGVAVLGNSNAGAGVPRASSNSRGGRIYKADSASMCQLLVLSPRGSTGSEQVQRLIRPASAPRGCRRLSPRRR